MSTHLEAEEKAHHGEMLESVAQQIVHPNLAIRCDHYLSMQRSFFTDLGTQCTPRSRNGEKTDTST